MTQATTEQFLKSTQTALADLGDAAATALSGFEQLVELNMAAAKATLAETAEQMQAVLSAKNPQDLAALQASLLQPMAEKATAYGRAVYGIATSTGAELSKAAEGKLAEAGATVTAGMDAALKYAPAGSESAVAAFKNALAQGQSAIDNAQSTAKKALEFAEKNVATATEMAVKATKSAGKTK
jgi:phasin family protein